MYSKDAVLRDENRAEYDELSAQLRARYTPRNPDQRNPDQNELVQTLIDARWRLQRIIALDGKMQFLSATEQCDSIRNTLPARWTASHFP